MMDALIAREVIAGVSEVLLYASVLVSGDHIQVSFVCRSTYE